MKSYKPDFMPLGRSAGYCSLTVLLGILNYFFDTNFAAKDNFDVFGLAKRGRRDRGNLLSMEEIALFLERLYLDVTHFSDVSTEDVIRFDQVDDFGKIEIMKKYIKPQYHHCIQGTQRVLDNGQTIDILDPLLSERIKQSSVHFEHEATADSLIQTVRAHQNPAGGVLFVLGVNYDILYGQASLSQDGGGHIVVSTGINEQDQCIIYEPIRPRPNPHLIATQKVMDAMADLGSLSMLMIKDNPSHV